MGQRGPLPQPDNVRRLRGNPGGRKTAPRPQPVRAIPAVPGWLDREAKAEWKRITPELNRLGLLSRLDRGVLALYCDAWSKWVSARGSIDALIVQGTKGDRKHPAWQIYRDAASMVASLAKELGTSPNARLRMELPEADSGDEADLD